MGNRPKGLLTQLVELRADVERFLAGESRKRANGNDGVEDKSQDVLTTAVESRDNYDPEAGDLRAWTLGIAANVSRDRDRAKRRYDARFSPDDGEAESTPAPTASPERITHWRDVQRKVAKAMEQLPPEFFEVLLLVGIEGRSHQEVAAELGISEALAKKRLERARTFLLKKSGLSRDDLRNFMPFLWLVGEDHALRLERLRKLAGYVHPTGNALGVIIGLLVLAPGPELPIARTGLRYRMPIVAAVQEAPQPTPPAAPPEPVPGSAVKPAKAPSVGRASRTPTVTRPPVVVDLSGMSFLPKGNR
ncbi:sigma-70 family RNA polymerase sigma factor [Polyangium sp. 15x6]|uniref:RNA polymerase sigma factor n=1 Tax=Polyangium sp. 15x6 TaxID=3042687 RepID=UPI00249C3CE1|nr:sigma-70 family RNA polymerase sigma factor [Polyangium sp. 15x6]MDI3285326.1 sigma-70 family RNA polymerase sigma factor [Polyangium sp. 15x6]